MMHDGMQYDSIQDEGHEPSKLEILPFLVNVTKLRSLYAIAYSVWRLSSVTLVHPTQPVEIIFRNFFHRTIAQGL